jgi:paraquat-inducible protein A
MDYTLACTLTGVLFFALANTFPLIRLELQGNTTTATLFGAVRALAAQELFSVAALVFITTMLVPALEICAMLYILLPLKLGRPLPLVHSVFRYMQIVRPWGMIEVFMLGILVAVVKLSTLAHVIPGVALWSFGALMVTFSAAAHFFNPRDVWQRLYAHA